MNLTHSISKAPLRKNSPPLPNISQYYHPPGTVQILENSCDASGVERQFEIVGEALTQAIQNNPSLVELISNSSWIISFL